MTVFGNRRGGQGSQARSGEKDARLVFGGGAALLMALLAGTATMALIAERPVYAQPASKYTQKDLGDQVAKADAAVARCDKAAARQEIDRLKKTKEYLDGAAKSGFVQGAAADAKQLASDLDALEKQIARCKDNVKVTGVGGETYAFQLPADGNAAQKGIDDAKAAAKACDRAGFKKAVQALKDRARAMQMTGIETIQKTHGSIEATGYAVSALLQLAADLEAAEAELFKHCAQPGKAEAPKEPAKTEPAKTGTGTGTGATPGQAPKPPEPPKAPPLTPDERASLWPANIFGGAAFTGEFFLAVGFRNNSADGEYASNGSQAPGSGKGSETMGNVGGGLAFYWPVYRFGYGPVWSRPTQFQAAQANGPLPPMDDDYPPSAFFAEWLALGTLSVGGRLMIDYLGDGKKEVLELVRHGPNGLVTLTESERSMVSLLLMVRMGFWFNCAAFGSSFSPEPAHAGDEYADADLAQAPRRPRRGNWWPVNVYAGVGPSFVRTKVTMTSNQAPGGGVFQTASETKTDTAWSFVLGAQTAACRSCVFGKPLMLGVEGQWTWLPSRSVSITSATFGFTETGRVASRSSSRMMFTASVPFTIGR